MVLLTSALFCLPNRIFEGNLVRKVGRIMAKVRQYKPFECQRIFITNKFGDIYAFAGKLGDQQRYPELNFGEKIKLDFFFRRIFYLLFDISKL